MTKRQQPEGGPTIANAIRWLFAPIAFALAIVACTRTHASVGYVSPEAGVVIDAGGACSNYGDGAVGCAYNGATYCCPPVSYPYTGGPVAECVSMIEWCRLISPPDAGAD